MARQQVKTKAPVDQDIIEKCLATTVARGDIVDFRFCFVPYSPLRDDSTEDIHSDKYDYLWPEEEDEASPLYREALGAVKQFEVRNHVRAQLTRKGPAQLPYELVLLLADNAVRLGKYTSAAQAYELLRIRRRMQESFFEEADRALDDNDIPRAVHGYLVATGLAYDYAAFPEPQPVVPNFQTRALMLHAEYPRRPEDALALQAPEKHVQMGLAYLLLDAEAAARLEARPLDQRVDFIETLIRKRDPGWDDFAARYREACALVDEIAERLERETSRLEGQAQGLAEEIEAAQDEQDPRHISAQLLGRELPEGEWWQYLKELAYLHPAAVLFVSRQIVSKDLEIVMPRYLKESPLPERLGLM